ncbi:MAG: hypothetical protein ACP5JO_01860, partial [Candidatus Ratteibacteria bacterium]
HYYIFDVKLVLLNFCRVTDDLLKILLPLLFAVIENKVLEFLLRIQQERVEFHCTEGNNQQ